MEALSCFRPFSSIPHASLRYRSSLAFCTNCSVVNVVPRKPLNKYVGLSMHHQRLEFCGLSYDIKLQKHCQLLRNIVARSELAGTESHDAAAYTLTGFRLGSKFRGVSFYAFISKTGIFVFPIIGWAMYLLGTIPLKRMDSRSQLDCLKCCMDLVRKGASVFFFPEGTRSKYGKLGVFKKGAFSVVAKTGVPVIPITLIGTGKLMPVGKEVSLNSGSVKVVIHKPLEGNNAGILCEKARKAIADDLFLLG